MKKITKFIHAALAACFLVLPFSSCKEEDGEDKETSGKCRVTKFGDFFHELLRIKFFLE